MSKLKKVAFTVYPCAELAPAREFYEGKLGLSPGLSGQHDGMFWHEYDLPGGGCLALSNAGGQQPSANAGGTIAFEVDDLDALTAELKGQGVPFVTDVIPGPKCRMIVCLDPAGNSILLHQLNG